MTLEHKNGIHEIKAEIEFNAEQHHTTREQLAADASPLTQERINQIMDTKSTATSGAVDCVIDAVGWPASSISHDGMVWEKTFTGQGADERFRAAFLQESSQPSLSNFFAQFRQAPTLEAGTYRNVTTQLNASRPALNRLFVVDPSLVQQIGIIDGMLSKMGNIEEDIAKFDTQRLDGTVYNAAVTLIRQAYMIYGRLVTSNDAKICARLNGHDVSDYDVLTNIDNYMIS